MRCSTALLIRAPSASISCVPGGRVGSGGRHQSIRRPSLSAVCGFFPGVVRAPGRPHLGFRVAGFVLSPSAPIGRSTFADISHETGRFVRRRWSVFRICCLLNAGRRLDDGPYLEPPRPNSASAAPSSRGGPCPSFIAHNPTAPNNPAMARDVCRRGMARRW